MNKIVRVSLDGTKTPKTYEIEPPDGIIGAPLESEMLITNASENLKHLVGATISSRMPCPFVLDQHAFIEGPVREKRHLAFNKNGRRFLTFSRFKLRETASERYFEVRCGFPGERVLIEDAHDGLKHLIGTVLVDDNDLQIEVDSSLMGDNGGIAWGGLEPQTEEDRDLQRRCLAAKRVLVDFDGNIRVK